MAEIAALIDELGAVRDQIKDLQSRATELCASLDLVKDEWVLGDKYSACLRVRHLSKGGPRDNRQIMTRPIEKIGPDLG